jgi:hypothetical protein
MRVVTSGGRSGTIFRFLVISFILLVIILTAGWFAVRSDGCRDLIESQLSKQLGLKVTIEQSRIGWPYVLVLENVRTPDFEAAGTPGFSVVEVRLGRRLREWSLILRQPILRVKEETPGSWEPAALARLADLNNARIADLVRATDGVRSKSRLKLRGGALAWLNADGAEIAGVRDVDFTLLPVRLGERRLHYYNLNIYRADGIALAQGRDLHWEWLTTRELEVIEIARESESVEQEEPSQEPISAEPAEGSES